MSQLEHIQCSKKRLSLNLNYIHVRKNKVFAKARDLLLSRLMNGEVVV